MVKKILISIPNVDDNIDWRVISAINAQVFDNEKYEITVFPIKNYGVVDGRNLSAQKCVKENFDYLLFVDSDTIIPNNFLETVLKNAEKGLQFISGWYFAKEIKNFQSVCLGLGVEAKGENRKKSFHRNSNEAVGVPTAAMGC